MEWKKHEFSSGSLASPPVHTSQGDEVSLHYTMQTCRFHSGLHLTPVPTADNKFINFRGQSLFLPLTNHANFSKNNLHEYWRSHEYLCCYKAFIESKMFFLDNTTWLSLWYRAQRIFWYSANNCKHGYYWNGNASCWDKMHNTIWNEEQALYIQGRTI